MKFSRSQVQRKACVLPQLKFENQTLTSFAGLVIFQKFFVALQLKARLRKCFRSLGGGAIYRRGTLFLQLIVHFLLGFRELQDARHYQNDPLVKRLLGLKQLPDVSTLSRMLRQATPASVARLRALLREMVLERLGLAALVRVTLDFDGSVQSTRRHAEGTAVGYNKKRKGARSYYPLFCTVAQTGQVLDFLHRPGNVHDSNGARAFILDCVATVRAALPGVCIEVRLDSAFFSDEIVTALAEAEVEFTLSVPFERFVELKRMIEERCRWHTLDNETCYFETAWKPQIWQQRFRFLFVRTRSRQQYKGPIQLDLFVPHEYGYEFKVIVTNKILEAQHIVAYHGGRGSQEGVFADLKSHCHLDYVPVRTLCGNQTYLLAGLFAHNLTRELQMQTAAPSRGTTRKRATLWVFEKLDTLRKTVIQRAGRLTQPHGVLTLTISASSSLKVRLLRTLAALRTAV
jgi:Transposase DDE domain group 1